jgi:RNA polymerase sporulation-specific sigma factor
LEQATDVFIPLCKAVAARYCPPGWVDFEDFFQEALIGAWEAVRTFRPALGGSLRSFVELCARRKMYDLLKVRGRHPEECLLDAPAWPEDGDRSPILGERFPAGTPGPEETVLARLALRDLFGALSQTERTVVVLVLRGLTYREIAAALGRDEKFVDNALSTVRRKARALGLT